MKKFIVTTTIHSPTQAILKFVDIAKRDDWILIVVGDLKTPHHEYKELDLIYLDPDTQQKKYPMFSESLGWNCIQRRNIGFVEAYKMGAEVIATVDDDNIPLDNWGNNIKVNELTTAPYYKCDTEVFDPLEVSIFNSHLWHRGYPVQLLSEKHKVTYSKTKEVSVLVQADLWNGSPDVDAICRIAFNPICDFSTTPQYFTSNKISPFNSQNTFLSRKLFPTYFLFPYIGRMDDIWASYITQYQYPNSVVYGPASVVQKRNKHDLVKDLEDEMMGYKHTIELVRDLDNWQKYLPKTSLHAYELYKKEFV